MKVKLSILIKIILHRFRSFKFPILNENDGNMRRESTNLGVPMKHIKSCALDPSAYRNRHISVYKQSVKLITNLKDTRIRICLYYLCIYRKPFFSLCSLNSSLE